MSDLEEQAKGLEGAVAERREDAQGEWEGWSRLKEKVFFDIPATLRHSGAPPSRFKFGLEKENTPHHQRMHEKMKARKKKEKGPGALAGGSTAAIVRRREQS